MSMQRYPHLLSPGKIGALDLRNRIVVTAMGMSLSEQDGSVGERLITYHEEQAKGGAGLIITGVTGVAWPVGAVAKQQTAISDDRFLSRLTRLCERVHAHGAKIAAQLHHGGLVGVHSAMAFGEHLWAPAIPPAPKGNFTDYFLTEELAGMQGVKPPQIRILDKADIARVVDQFAAGARRAREAGFDGIEIHSGHGYLLSSFISPHTNSRSDEYGGSRENRMRLTLEVLQAARRAVGPDFPVWVKLDSREEGRASGITIEDAIENARMVEAAGADAIAATAYHDAGQAKLHSQSHTPHDPALNLPFVARIKKAVSIPVIGSGRVEPEVGDRSIAAGELDFLAMGRKLLADPYLPGKLAAGEAEKVRPCIYCYTCISAIYMGEEGRCAINPELAHEFEREAAKTAPSHVVVVGAGPGGLEATRRLRALGHRVTLIEQRERLGGTLLLAALAYQPNEAMLKWLCREVETSGADVRVKTIATPALLADLAPDHVIVATGARRDMPAIPGAYMPHVFSGDDMRQLMLGETAGEVRRKTSIFTRLAIRAGAITGASANLDLARKVTRAWMPLGRRIAIIGGELVGLELAEFLAERSRGVSVIEEAPRMGKGLPLVRRMRLLAELEEHGVSLHAGASAVAIDQGRVTFAGADGKQCSIAVDTVIVAIGATSDRGLADELIRAGHAVQVIGDATGVGYIEGAMRGAAQAVRQIVRQTARKGDMGDD